MPITESGAIAVAGAGGNADVAMEFEWADV